MKGYMGKLLRVNLTSGSVKVETPKQEVLRNFLGGRGLGVKILYDELKPNTDPLSPDNKMIFATGPLTGTRAPSSGFYCVITKSPATGAILTTLSGGQFGHMLKCTGFDAIVIEGKSAKPIYLWINNGKCEIKNASKVWGKDTAETDDALRKETSDKARVCCIGPAGENLVKRSCLINDKHRAAGRGGVGAVMGSKNLKAIVVYGDQKIEVANSKAFDEAVKVAREAMSKHPTVRHDGVMNHLGTASSVNQFNTRGLLPTRNFQECVFEGASNISGETIEKTINVGKNPCWGCPIACAQMVEVKEGPYAGIKGAGPEFETLALMGSSCGIDNLGALVKANQLCNQLGLDTISTGNAIAFAMECYERGLLTKKDTGGIELKFGNHQGMLQVVEKIAKKEGIGSLLADGVKVAAEKIGKGSEKFAMHVKGLELTGYDVRGAKGMALAYATSNMGASHNRGNIIKAEVFRHPKPVDRYSYQGKGPWLKTFQDVSAIMDSMTMCDFTNWAITGPMYAEMVSKATGFDIDEAELMTIGDRIFTLERAFNAREGLGRKDDTLPPRYFNEPLRQGPGKGEVVNREQFDQMLDGYYQVRKLDRQGHPLARKMKSLGL